MEIMQESEWLEAQDTVISKDLALVAKQQLDFLAAVDRRRFLYDGPLLERAIYRYKTCWLPLLAKHTESAIIEGSLVVPLDCEWIWHCHRLNPVQYKKDCEKFYGRILDNENVESSIHDASYDESAKIWAKYYKDEPFKLEYSCISMESSAQMNSKTGETITYDLVSAVKRQSTFYYQVARPSMHDPRFLKEAEARYKGFLHLIKRNQEKSINRFCVPTYDIDLMWHSHQLQPMAYCKDMLQLFGKILEHDDTDADRSKGMKLDTGFHDTTKQWEDTYGSRYWRAGAMYKGSMPSPLDVPLVVSRMNSERMPIMDKSSLLQLPLQKTTATEVLLQIVGIRNFLPSQKGDLFVAVSKKQPDIFFSGSCKLTIASETGEKQAISFQCEPKGELLFELMIEGLNSVKSVGTTTVPLQNLMDQNSKLCFEKWVELKLHSKNAEFKPISLRIAASFTVPFEAPHVIEMLRPSSGFLNALLFPLRTRDRKIQRWARFVDVNGSDIISLQMRDVKEKKGVNKGLIKRKVVGITELSSKPIIFAEYVENTWSIKDYDLSITIEKINIEGDLEFQLLGDNQIKFFPGKKLQYQPKNCNHDDLNCITAVEFSADHPYGKAVALLNTKSSLIEVNEEWHMLPAIVLMYILKNEGLSGKHLKSVTSSESKAIESSKLISVEPARNVKGGGCGGGCGSGCGNLLGAGESVMVTKGAGGCGSGCGGGCGNMVANGHGGGCGSGCGGGCGSECGNMLAKGSGGGCENMVASGCGGGCGSGCGGGCGNMVASGCGGGCGGGGGCGNVIIQVSA